MGSIIEMCHGPWLSRRLHLVIYPSTYVGGYKLSTAILHRWPSVESADCRGRGTGCVCVWEKGTSEITVDRFLAVNCRIVKVRRGLFRPKNIKPKIKNSRKCFGQGEERRFGRALEKARRGGRGNFGATSIQSSEYSVNLVLRRLRRATNKATLTHSRASSVKAPPRPKPGRRHGISVRKK